MTEKRIISLKKATMSENLVTRPFDFNREVSEILERIIEIQSDIITEQRLKEIDGMSRRAEIKNKFFEKNKHLGILSKEFADRYQKFREVCE